MKCVCTSCNNFIQFHGSMLGQRTICPHCRNEVLLPSGGSNEIIDDEGYSIESVAHPNVTRYNSAGQRLPQFECPFCHTTIPPHTYQKISTAGWVTFGVLLVVCFPLFWIGLLITEPERKCSGCAIRLG